MKPSVRGISSQYVQRIHFTTGCAGPVAVCTCTGPMTKWSPAPAWQFPQVFGRFAAFTVDRGSSERKMLCTPWQEAQLATLWDPPRWQARGSCRRRKEPGRRAGCSAMPGVHRCGIARKWPWRRGKRSPAIPALSAPGSGAPHGNRCTPGRRTRRPSWLVHAHSQDKSWLMSVWHCPQVAGDIPVVDFGTRILRGKDSMAPVTIRAGCGGPVSIRHRSPMHALSIEFHRMREWNLVPGEKLLVAVTGCASVRQIFLGYRRGCIARGLDLMRGPVAGHAVRCIRVACLQPLVRVCSSRKSFTSSAWHCAHFAGAVWAARPPREDRRGRIGKLRSPSAP